MTEFWAPLRQRIPNVKPWVAVAVLLAVGLLGYNLSLGFRYWTESRELASNTREIDSLSDALRRTETVDEAVLKEELSLREEQLAAVSRLFDSCRTRLDRARDDAESRHLLRALGCACLEEHAEWILLHRERPLDAAGLSG